MNQKRLIVVVLFMLTIALGVSAIYVGMRLRDQPVTPVDTRAYGNGVIFNVCGGDVNNFGLCGSGANDCNDSRCVASGGSNVVQVYRCTPEQTRIENGVVACDGDGGGQRLPDVTTANYDDYFNASNACFIIQLDVFVNGSLTDFVAWEGDKFDSQDGCGVIACPYEPVNTEFFMWTEGMPVEQRTSPPEWRSGNNINITTAPVYMAVNCFANNGSKLLGADGGNPKIRITYPNNTTEIINGASLRNKLLSDHGNYSVVCYTEDYGGITGSCSNTDSFTLAQPPTTPPVTTPVVTTPVVTTPVVTTPVVTTPVVTTPVVTTPVVTTPVVTTPVVTTPVVTTPVVTTPPVTVTPLPETALISDEVDRLIIGVAFMLVGFWIYASGGYRVIGNVFWNAVGPKITDKYNPGSFEEKTERSTKRKIDKSKGKR